MRPVTQLPESFWKASGSFGNPSVFNEAFVTQPPGDTSGNLLDTSDAFALDELPVSFWKASGVTWTSSWLTDKPDTRCFDT